MTIMEHLEGLRASRQGCLVVAYGDALTQLVLRASHDKTYRREHLDQLCIRAADSFRMMDATAKARRGDPGTHEAMMLSARATTVVVRRDTNASEFLCVVCDRPDALEALVCDARETLALITAGL